MILVIEHDGENVHYINLDNVVILAFDYQENKIQVITNETYYTIRNFKKPLSSIEDDYKFLIGDLSN